MVKKREANKMTRLGQRWKNKKILLPAFRFLTPKLRKQMEQRQNDGFQRFLWKTRISYSLPAPLLHASGAEVGAGSGMESQAGY